MTRKIILLLGLILSSLSWAETAPSWQLQRLDKSDTLSLEQLQGQIVLVDFWASWCVPCRPAMQALSQLQADYAEAPVKIVPISVDEDVRDAQRFVQRYGPSLISLHDPDGQIAEAYKLIGMPSSFVIAPDGQIALRHHGYRQGDDAQWRQAIDDLLASMAQASKPAI